MNARNRGRASLPGKSDNEYLHVAVVAVFAALPLFYQPDTCESFELRPTRAMRVGNIASLLTSTDS